jgi:predicted HAD superfamily Cof-like phosphohydrolase
MKENNIVEIADAIADSIYVLIGTALEYGIPLDAVWGEVQISNMAKVDLDTGKVRRREDGKVLKSEGWTKPDIRKALYG